MKFLHIQELYISISYLCRLTVTDSDGEEDHDDVTVNVLPGKFNLICKYKLTLLFIYLDRPCDAFA